MKAYSQNACFKYPRTMPVYILTTLANSMQAWTKMIHSCSHLFPNCVAIKGRYEQTI